MIMKAKITIKSNGSIRVEGDFEVYDDQGVQFDVSDAKKISLCRCALSEKMPFCDGAHSRCGFVSSISANPIAIIDDTQKK